MQLFASSLRMPPSVTRSSFDVYGPNLNTLRNVGNNITNTGNGRAKHVHV